MTCANYIKLPPYSSKLVLAERLMYAINEGQGSFDLS
jgi:E3 ubiquitin-protein ligase TRIP12